MPLTAQCNLCSSDLTNPQKLLIFSSILPRSDSEAHLLLAQELTNHIQTRHPKALQEIAESMPLWATFNLIKHFSADENSQAFEKEKERMREDLIERVMLGAVDEDEDYEDEEPDDDEDEDDDLDEDEEDELSEEDEIDFDEEEEEALDEVEDE